MSVGERQGKQRDSVRDLGNRESSRCVEIKRDVVRCFSTMTMMDSPVVYIEKVNHAHRLRRAVGPSCNTANYHIGIRCGGSARGTSPKISIASGPVIGGALMKPHRSCIGKRPWFCTWPGIQKASEGLCRPDMHRLSEAGRPDATQIPTHRKCAAEKVSAYLETSTYVIAENPGSISHITANSLFGKTQKPSSQ